MRFFFLINTDSQTTSNVDTIEQANIPYVQIHTTNNPQEEQQHKSKN